MTFNTILHSRRLPHIAGLMLAGLIWLANSANPPNGNTGAPFDGTCANSNCHGSTNPLGFGGNVTVTGLPATIDANTTYPLVITVTPTAGSPTRGGFQLVAVGDANQNAGDLTAGNAQSGTEMSGGREYIEHRGPKNFGGNPISWSFNWRSPGAFNSTEIDFYFTSVIADGNDDNTNDFVVTSNLSRPYGGPLPVSAQITAFTNLSCNGVSTGSATVTASNGTAPYTYAWSGSAAGNTGATANNLAAGTYTVTVTGSASSGTATASVTLTQPTVLSVTVQSTGGITCNQPSLNLSATASGGTASYSYAWSNLATTPQTSVTQPGTYTVTVTDGNGCTRTATRVVQSNTTAPTATIQPGNNVLTCAAPTILLNGSGSSTGAGFSYLWSTADGNIVSGASTLTPTVDECGTYVLLVTNSSNGCTATASTTVSCDLAAPNLGVLGGTVSCALPTTQICASSTTPNVTYAWSGPDNFVSTQNCPFVSPPGSYTVTATAPNGCTASATAQVAQISGLTLSVIVAPVVCAGGGNGGAAVQVVGGAMPYTYLWSNGGTDPGVSNLVAGSYTVTVTDNSGCTASAIANITQPGPIMVNASATAQTFQGANDGTATAAPTGGAPNYSFLWSNGGNTASISGLAPGLYTVTVTDANGCMAGQEVTVAAISCNLGLQLTDTDVSCNGALSGGVVASSTGGTAPVGFLWSNSATTQAISGLAAGTYTVTATDANGCTAIATALITQPNALTVNTNATTPSAVGINDGSASASASGGVPGYGYVWSNGGNTAGISGLAPGLYTVTATDANGCTATATATVPIIVCNLTAEASATSVRCFGTASGTAEVFSSGGAGVVSYAWSSAATGSSLDGLLPGVYTVTATDALGCTAVANDTVFAPPSLLEVSATDIVAASCPTTLDGSAAPLVSGGWGDPYQFVFSWGLGGFANLGAGQYSFTVTDGGGCAQVANFVIGVGDTLGPQLVCPEDAVLCGADLYTYTLPLATDNCDPSVAAPVLVSGQPSGSAFLDGETTQVFSVTDLSGNTSTCSFTVTVFPVPDVTFSSSNDVNGAGVGSIDITVIGGAAPYAFNWRRNGAPFATTEDLSGLNMGFYTLVVTDGNGCTVQLAPIEIDNLVGADEPFAALPMRLWPNPTRDFLQLEAALPRSPLALELLNAQGQLVRQVLPELWREPIEVGSLPAGFYYLRLVAPTGQQRLLKWVKMD
jgi:hypothetical protein